MTKIPHKAIILVRSENYPYMLDGRMNPRPSKTESKLYEFEGDSADEVNEKVTKFNEELEKLYENLR